MSEKRDGRPALTLLRGGLSRELRMRQVSIVAAPAGMPPFPVDAEVVEEDTYHVLSVDPTVREVDEHVVRLMTEVIETRPGEPGSVVVRRGHPARILAIVHDLDREPTWREEWVEKALHGVFGEVERRGWQAVALPMIGTLYGALRPQRFAELLGRVMDRASFPSLKKLWLVVPEKAAAEVLRVLEGVSAG